MFRFVSRMNGFGRRHLGLPCKVGRHLNTESGGRLAGKVALITGGASGIGKATATEFIRNGAKVVIADIQTDLGKATASDLGPAATFITCDVTKESDVSSAVSHAVSTHGRLDILHSNAGIGGSTNTGGIADLDMAEFDRVMAANARSVVLSIKHAARVMIPRRSGSIVCTASVTGVLAGMAPHPYSVSKCAVLGIVRSACAELAMHGVRVNCVSPFVIPTRLVMEGLAEIYEGVDEERLAGMARRSGELAGAECETEDIAKAVAYLASDDAKYVSGHNLVVDGGFTVFKRLNLPSLEG
ncbi:Sex determination protein tasselseed-2 [Acorus calamus]|uniref:Sex determination protein tasselseed-2 n=1 Tax=Acorus calamus TaxID=4465 RepID=A0AAV9CZS1_ACOCL|nr:Sex determination protein tasselseed-2 [Acorus calamus]